MAKAARRQLGHCALCGRYAVLTREHVMPRNLCPPSKRASWRPIIVPACAKCNNGSADQDAHFRNVLMMAGTKNAAVQELWEGPVLRGLHQVDGRRRMEDLLNIMTLAPDAGPGRYRIFPANDESVRQTVRKITRGLCHHHGLPGPVLDADVFSDILRLPAPAELKEYMTHFDALPGVFSYSYAALGNGARSMWLLVFFERTPFVSLVGDWEPSN